MTNKKSAQNIVQMYKEELLLGYSKPMAKDIAKSLFWTFYPTSGFKNLGKSIS